jgi:hypothetical protein
MGVAVKITIEFETGNDAFQQPYGQLGEVTRILGRVGDLVSMYYTDGPVRDSNGNTVGAWRLERQEEETW